MNAPPGYPLSEGLYPSTTVQYRSFVFCLQKKNNNQTSGLRNRNVPFHWARKITGIFVEWKVPRGVLLCVGQNKASQPAVSLSKMQFGAKKTARLSLVEPREMIG